MILCPKHKKELFIKRIKIDILNHTKEIVAAKCDQCDCMYTNYQLVGFSDSFEKDGIKYVFLQSLAKEYPMTEDNFNEDEKHTLHKETKRLKKKEKEDNKRKKNLHKKDKHKENEYIAKRIDVVLKLPKYCHNQRTIVAGKLQFTYLGNKITTSGRFCKVCGTAYVEKTFVPADTVKEELKNIEVLKESVWDFALELNKPECVKRERKVNSELTTVLLKGKYGQEYLVTVVAEEKHQDSAKNIFWSGRSISKKILNGIASREARILFNDEPCILVNYSDTFLLRQYLGITDGISDSGADEVIWIYRAKLPCADHQVESVTAYVPSMNDGQFYPINVTYCKKCNKYYINSVSFNQYSGKYGMPDIKLAVSDSTGKFNDYSTWNEESILHFIGYNVSGTDNLSDTDRQKILSQAIESGMVRKADVISFIETLIRRSERQNRMKYALLKWKKDLQYVLEYQIKNQRKVYGKICLHKK